MRVYAILLLFIHKVLAIANDAEVLNVGTSLFSPSDLKKDDWTLIDVGLLKARRYFQYVLPHPFVADPSIDHFADLILNYFTDSIGIVKRAELDPVSREILTTALYDTIGGYMKACVLPVTKYGYYGGTVSKDDAQKLYQFYDDIKSYLKTDGSGWTSFDGKFVKPLKIIATLPRDFNRPTREACNQLAFYEETPLGFSIPLPSINFDTQSPVMFLPLKGNSLICLNSPSSADTLLSYYHTAKSCLKTRSPKVEAEFDSRFQSWLTDDVITHLEDGYGEDELYYALGGILTLAVDQKEGDFPPVTNIVPIKTPKPYIHINFGSKKVLILAIILFLEVVWCVPALLYMLYRRRKKRKENENCDVLLFVHPNKDKNNQFSSSSAIQTVQTQSSLSTSCDDNTCESVKRFKKKYFRIQDTRQNPSSQNLELQTSGHMVGKCSKGTSNRSFFCSKQCSTGSYNVENERLLKKPTRSALKNTSTQIFNECSHSPKPKLIESYNSMKTYGKPSIQNVAEKYIRDNILNLQDDMTCKSKENVLSRAIESAINNHKSSNEQALIQMESCNNMGRLRHSNMSIKNQQSLNEISDLCKSSIATLTQGKSNTDTTILQQSKDKMNTISYRDSKKGEISQDELGNRAVIAQNIEKETASLKCHETAIQKSKENMLREYKSHDSTINVRQSHACAVVVRKSVDDDKIQQRSNQDVVIRRKSKQNLSKEYKPADTIASHTSNKNYMEILGDLNNTEKQSHANDDDDAPVLGNDITMMTVAHSFELEENTNHTLTMIENLDQEAKILQKSANELIELMNERQGACGRTICDCTCCQPPNPDKNCTEIQLKPCATVTLIGDDESSEKSASSRKSICDDHQNSEVNLAATTCKPLSNTTVICTNLSKSEINTRSTSLNIIQKLKGTKSSAKEENKDLTRHSQSKDKRSDIKEENKQKKKSDSKEGKKESIKKTQKNNEKKCEKNADKKVEKSKRNYGFKFTGGNKALFEVKIEKPNATISVGVTRGLVVSKAPKSRIPTRVIRDNVVRFDETVNVFKRRLLEPPIGSKIPMPVRKTTDDIVLRHSRNKATTPDPRLNVTL